MSTMASENRYLGGNLVVCRDMRDAIRSSGLPRQAGTAPRQRAPSVRSRKAGTAPRLRTPSVRRAFPQLVGRPDERVIHNSSRIRRKAFPKPTLPPASGIQSKRGSTHRHLPFPFQNPIFYLLKSISRYLGSGQWSSEIKFSKASALRRISAMSGTTWSP
jgi:hypothetical protein